MKTVRVAVGFATLTIFPPLLFAAIMNLEISAAAKFLCVVGSICVIALFQALNSIEKQLIRCAYWTRLTFISTHIRNENDNLEPAMSRLADDLVRDKYDNETELFADRVTTAIVVASLLIVTPVILYFGLFGTTGQQAVRGFFD
jgi:hypothetical protein